jgi:hypothetical protein
MSKGKNFVKKILRRKWGKILEGAAGSRYANSGMIEASFPAKKEKTILPVRAKKRPGSSPARWEFLPKRVQ